MIQSLIINNAEQREELRRLRQAVYTLADYVDDSRVDLRVLHAEVAALSVNQLEARETEAYAHAQAYVRAQQARGGPSIGTNVHLSGSMTPGNNINNGASTPTPTATVELGPPRSELTRLMRHTAVSGSNLSRVLRERARAAPPSEWADALALIAEGEANCARMWRRIHGFVGTTSMERHILYALTGSTVHIEEENGGAGAGPSSETMNAGAGYAVEGEAKEEYADGEEEDWEGEEMQEEEDDYDWGESQ